MLRKTVGDDILMTQEQHSKALEYLLGHPHVLGVREPIIWAAREVKVYKSDGITLATDIDVLYFTRERVVAAEYKTEPNLRRAEHQLILAYDMILKHMRVRPELWYVVGPKFEAVKLR